MGLFGGDKTTVQNTTNETNIIPTTNVNTGDIGKGLSDSASIYAESYANTGSLISGVINQAVSTISTDITTLQTAKTDQLNTTVETVIKAIIFIILLILVAKDTRK